MTMTDIPAEVLAAGRKAARVHGIPTDDGRWADIFAAGYAAGRLAPPLRPTTPDGNRPDSCGHCELLPTVNGAIVRAVRSSCPTHAGITSTRPPS